MIGMTRMIWPVCHDHLALACNNGISLGHAVSVKLPDPVECSIQPCEAESIFEVAWAEEEA